MSNPRATMDKLQEAAARRGEQLAEEMNDALDSAHDMAHDALSEAEDAVSRLHRKAKPAINKYARRSEEFLRSGLARSKDAGLRAKDATEAYVADQPLKSVAIAAATGAAVAALLVWAMRRDR